jgi:hypothetical protein
VRDRVAILEAEVKQKDCDLGLREEELADAAEVAQASLRQKGPLFSRQIHINIY